MKYIFHGPIHVNEEEWKAALKYFFDHNINHTSDSIFTTNSDGFNKIVKQICKEFRVQYYPIMTIYDIIQDEPIIAILIERHPAMETHLRHKHITYQNIYSPNELFYE